MHAPDGIRTTSRCLQSPKHMQSPQGQVQDPQCSSRVASLSELPCELIFALRYSLGLASVASPLQSCVPSPGPLTPLRSKTCARELSISMRGLFSEASTSFGSLGAFTKAFFGAFVAYSKAFPFFAPIFAFLRALFFGALESSKDVYSFKTFLPLSPTVLSVNLGSRDSVKIVAPYAEPSAITTSKHPRVVSKNMLRVLGSTNSRQQVARKFIMTAAIAIADKRKRPIAAIAIAERATLT